MIVTENIAQAHSDPEHFTTNLAWLEAGRATEQTPPVETCEHCGEQLPTVGIVVGEGGSIFTRALEESAIRMLANDGVWWRGRAYKGRWRTIPERCTCWQARQFWAEYDAKARAEQARLDREREEAERRSYIEQLVIKSGLDEGFFGMSFETWRDDLETERTSFAARSCRQFAENFSRMTDHPTKKGLGIYLTGSPGCGKTHLAAATCRAIVAGGNFVIAIRDVDLYQRFRRTYDRQPSYDAEREFDLLEMFQTVDLLMIDDLGKAKPSSWTLEKLFAIVDKRLAKRLSTIVTTNYSDSELIERLGNGGRDKEAAQAIVSRLRGAAVHIDCGTRDIRIKRAASA